MLRQALAAGAFPAASAVVGDAEKVLFRFEQVAPGTPAAPRSPRSPAASARGDEPLLYDLASLTKMMATATVALRLVASGTLDLEAPLSRYLDTPPDKAGITILDLLRHTGGFDAHFFVSEADPDPARVIDSILARPLACDPGTAVVYSCIGFILLGRLIEGITGDSLDALSRRLVFSPLALEYTGYCPVSDSDARFERCRVLPTEPDTETGEYWCGVVHDENARFLGGVSGNAGLFSTVDDCAMFARMLLRRGEGLLSEAQYELMVRDWTPDMEASRGLGVSRWNGSAEWPPGPHLGPGAYGHTGFTGTSIYVSPSHGLYFVLLTNRVAFGREVPVMPRYRADFHDAAVRDFGRRSEGSP
jgi:CubicO group peptidase (beta-lactamase class C family)